MKIKKIIKKLEDKNEVLRNYILETYEKTYLIDIETMFEVMVMLSDEIDDLIKKIKEKNNEKK